MDRILYAICGRYALKVTAKRVMRKVELSLVVHIASSAKNLGTTRLVSKIENQKRFVKKLLTT